MNETMNVEQLDAAIATLGALDQSMSQYDAWNECPALVDLVQAGVVELDHACRRDPVADIVAGLKARRQQLIAA